MFGHFRFPVHLIIYQPIRKSYTKKSPGEPIISTAGALWRSIDHAKVQPDGIASGDIPGHAAGERGMPTADAGAR